MSPMRRADYNNSHLSEMTYQKPAHGERRRQPVGRVIYAPVRSAAHAETIAGRGRAGDGDTPEARTV